MGFMAGEARNRGKLQCVLPPTGASFLFSSEEQHDNLVPKHRDHRPPASLLFRSFQVSLFVQCLRRCAICYLEDSPRLRVRRAVNKEHR